MITVYCTVFLNTSRSRITDLAGMLLSVPTVLGLLQLGENPFARAYARPQRDSGARRSPFSRLFSPHTQTRTHTHTYVYTFRSSVKGPSRAHPRVGEERRRGAQVSCRWRRRRRRGRGGGGNTLSSRTNEASSVANAIQSSTGGPRVNISARRTN